MPTGPIPEHFRLAEAAIPRPHPFAMGAKEPLIEAMTRVATVQLLVERTEMRLLLIDRQELDRELTSGADAD
jgi:hypothetical protein